MFALPSVIFLVLSYDVVTKTIFNGKWGSVSIYFIYIPGDIVSLAVYLEEAHTIHKNIQCNDFYM